MTELAVINHETPKSLPPIVVFKDAIEWTRIVEMKQGLAEYTTPPIQFICQTKECRGEPKLSPIQIEVLCAENPEPGSIWIADPYDESSLSCVFTMQKESQKDTNGPLCDTLLGDRFRDSIIKRFHQYIHVLNLLGPSSISCTIRDKDKNDWKTDGKASIGGKVKVWKAGGPDIRGDLQAQLVRSFNKEINAAFTAHFDGGARPVDMTTAENEIRRYGFENDLVVKALVRARRQHTPVATMDYGLDADVMTQTGMAFGTVARLQLELPKLWKTSLLQLGVQADASFNVENYRNAIRAIRITISDRTSGEDKS